MADQPATTISRKCRVLRFLAATTKAFDESSSVRLRAFAKSNRGELATPAVSAVRLPQWFDSTTSWPSGNPANFALLADLERRLPLLEDESTGTRVGIGVATGADSVFLTRYSNLVEADRLLQLLITRDTTAGRPEWSGTYLVNRWENGKLVDLAEYPRLDRYLGANGAEIRRRHVAQTNPNRWYQTIDRVEPGLLERPKLVIPDLKAFIQPVLDPGKMYPHHGLYFITSDGWDPEVLGGLLLSDVAELFVSM